MSTTLHITLGHNASAALAIDGHVVRAYEQERLDRKKNSSAYPRQAIALALGDLQSCDCAFVGHWFDDQHLKSNKYLDLNHLASVAGHIISPTLWRTHHDMHAVSVSSFFRSHVYPQDMTHTVVLDGFGSFQECFSFYCGGYLTHRTYGYENSLGLMYQYATEYLGLRPNQDEYKLLGYESRVLEHMPRSSALSIQAVVIEQADRHAEVMQHATDKPKQIDELIDYDALEIAKRSWLLRIDAWRHLYPVDTKNGVRALVAFCAQTFLERCATQMIGNLIPYAQFDRRSLLLLCGGCHLNVKLNRAIQIATGLRTLSHPLSGDQGTALGIAPWAPRCDTLELGGRTLGGRDTLPIGVYVVDRDQWVYKASQLLEAGQVVNVVRGAMEFGPRALCNTTTFANPTRASVAAINALNDRDEAMPMAPVMTREAADRLLCADELLAVGPSAEYMITTCAFRGEPSPHLAGVAHSDPLTELWTARPQVVDFHQSDLYALLLNTSDGVLINTSFNYHGEPIVFTEDDACRTHEMQSFRALTLGLEQPTTLIVRSET